MPKTTHTPVIPQSRPQANKPVFNASQAKHIDLTKADDKEVISFGASDVASMAGNFNAISETLNDISCVLGLSIHDKVSPNAVKSLVCLSHIASEQWAEISYSHVVELNKTLKQTEFGEVK